MLLQVWSEPAQQSLRKYGAAGHVSETELEMNLCVKWISPTGKKIHEHLTSIYLETCINVNRKKIHEYFSWCLSRQEEMRGVDIISNVM